jgi:hypothetical protein
MYVIVVKSLLNVLAETVADDAPALLTLGSTAATKLPTNTAAARAFPVLNFIPPNLF